jgi:hypothetical protein
MRIAVCFFFMRNRPPGNPAAFSNQFASTNEIAGKMLVDLALLPWRSSRKGAKEERKGRKET